MRGFARTASVPARKRDGRVLPGDFQATISRPIGDRETQVMDKESVERLRFDRRLKRRSGWISASDEEAYLASLPDVSDKMTTIAEEEEKAAEETVASPSAADEGQPSAAAPTAGDFSTPSPFSGAGGGFGGQSSGS